jgi:hypothetical protein
MTRMEMEEMKRKLITASDTSIVVSVYQAQYLLAENQRMRELLDDVLAIIDKQIAPRICERIETFFAENQQ